MKGIARTALAALVGCLLVTLQTAGRGDDNPPTLTAGNSYVWNVRVVDGTQSGLPNSNNYFQAPGTSE